MGETGRSIRSELKEKNRESHFTSREPPKELEFKRRETNVLGSSKLK